jgi:hypothetical protein
MLTRNDAVNAKEAMEDTRNLEVPLRVSISPPSFTYIRENAANIENIDTMGCGIRPKRLQRLLHWCQHYSYQQAYRG